MNTFAIKIIAVICMLLDHIAYFFPDVPVVFHWIGRIAAPIFVFGVVNGMKYTHNPKRYMFRLYLFSVLMAVFQVYAYAREQVSLNFLRTLFMISLFIYFLECRKKDKNLFNKYIKIYIIYQIVIVTVNACLCRTELCTPSTTGIFRYLFPAVFGSLLAMNGGLFWVGLGVLFYVFRENKVKLSVSYAGFVVIYELIRGTTLAERFLNHFSRTISGFCYIQSAVEYLSEALFAIELPFTGGGLIGEYQWMMIFSLPFILLYNHKQGPKVKWFFYVFYPLHIIVLWMISPKV